MIAKKKQHALITGGSGAIGSAIARKFASQGYKVSLFYHKNKASAEAVAEEIRQQGGEALALENDIRNLKAVEKSINLAVLEHGCVDVLVSNAGVSNWKLFTDLEPEEFRDIMDVHVTGLYNVVKGVLPGMISRKSGRIITISSIWGITGASCEVAYSTAKAAMIGFTKALAKEVGPSGITVNSVAPGVIETRMNQFLDSEALAALCEETPVGRQGTPEEVAETVAFLAGENSGFLTGQVISPNGGLVI